MFPLHNLLLCALSMACWESGGRAEECRAAPQPAGQGFPSNSTFHSSFCIRYLVFLFFSHLQEFTAVKGVLKQENCCYSLWPEAHQSTSFHWSAEPLSNRDESAIETRPPTVPSIIYYSYHLV